eukprot:TRINITY_DN47543_c0_g1_i1.p1 TRINITY_DN47543_c0_g1~~TRINITY_DN47543_c0_g1_i1.p1  ORF type:complete len:253 (+),score=38.08 TRINITY_DN47543_c0_g1_i1:41-760(+)
MSCSCKMNDLLSCCADESEEKSQMTVSVGNEALYARISPDDEKLPFATSKQAETHLESIGRAGAENGKQFEIAWDDYDPRRLGLELDLTDNSRGPTISRVVPGMAKAWNDQNPAEALKVHDRISALNGRRGTASDLFHRIMEPHSTLRLTIHRPELFNVQAIKSTELGVSLHYKNISVGAVVNKITDGGLFAKWNSDHPERTISVGDRIIAVHGQAMKGKDLVSYLKEATELVLTIAHY